MHGARVAGGQIGRGVFGLNMGLDVFNVIFTKFSALCCLPFAIWVVYGFTGALSSQHLEFEILKITCL